MPALKILFPFILLAIVSCNTTQKVPSTTEPILEQLDILLKDGIQPAKLEAIFTKYKLTKSKGLSFKENRWVFTFDSNLISLENIIKELKDIPNVLEVKTMK